MGTFATFAYAVRQCTLAGCVRFSTDSIILQPPVWQCTHAGCSVSRAGSTILQPPNKAWGGPERADRHVYDNYVRRAAHGASGLAGVRHRRRAVVSGPAAGGQGKAPAGRDPPETAGGGGGSPAGGAGDFKGLGAASGDRGSSRGDAGDPEGAGLLRGGGEGAAEGAGGLEEAEPLGDILVTFPMGTVGLVLPAAVCAAMALQIHWASSTRSAARPAQERGEPCAWALSRVCDNLTGPLAVACVAAQCAATGMPAHAPAGSPRCVCVLYPVTRMYTGTCADTGDGPRMRAVSSGVFGFCGTWAMSSAMLPLA